MTINIGRPARGRAFLRRITTEETYRGGKIVITPKSRDKVAEQQFVVVAVGECELCDDEDCRRLHWAISDFGQPGKTPPRVSSQGHWCDFDKGDWVLVRNRAWGPTPDPDVFVVWQRDVLGKFIETVPPPPAPPGHQRSAGRGSRGARGKAG